MTAFLANIRRKQRRVASERRKKCKKNLEKLLLL